MSYLGDKDFQFEIAKGNVAGHKSVNKFGRNTNVDATVTDIWDLTTQPIWVAPTQARTHDIASTSTNDDGSPAGTGAQTLRVSGLTGWDANEVTEDITLNGTTNVPTVNSYVIIHRMQVLTWGSAGPNAGTLTATAQTDATVTAQINIGAGQTEMAIYGVPSTQKAYMTQYYAGVRASGPSGNIFGELLVNSYADTELTNFLVKHSFSRVTTAPTTPHEFHSPAEFAGPCIIKIQATGSTVNLEVDAGFDLILVDN